MFMIIQKKKKQHIIYRHYSLDGIIPVSQRFKEPPHHYYSF